MASETAQLGQVLLLGDHSLVSSVAVNLLEAGHQVILITQERGSVTVRIDSHLKNISTHRQKVDKKNIRIQDELSLKDHSGLTILITREDEEQKINLINQVEELVSHDSIIAVNIEGIPLKELQKNKRNPERIMGLNWAEPAFNTFFLEMIKNDQTSQDVIEYVKKLAVDFWNKDPYVIDGELGIHSRIFASMVREAFYLLENGFASVEDIDRAFRNDAGFYLPFCGNLRYMDLMGTYAYGLVMKELNPDLCKAEHLPSTMENLMSDGAYGMEARRGLYKYTGEELKEWKYLAERFSFKIRDIMRKYPFEYEKK